MRYAISLLVVLICCVAGCDSGREDSHKMVRDEVHKSSERRIISPMKTIGPYSPAVQIGKLLFVSGQIGLDQSTGQLRSETIEIETRQALENMNTILNAAGYDSSDVVNATVYLKNMSDYAKMNTVYGGYFGEDNYPARTTVAINELPKHANVEITVIACK